MRLSFYTLGRSTYSPLHARTEISLPFCAKLVSRVSVARTCTLRHTMRLVVAKFEAPTFRNGRERWGSQAFVVVLADGGSAASYLLCNFGGMSCGMMCCSMAR
jgi:hypothetical protein